MWQKLLFIFLIALSPIYASAQTSRDIDTPKSDLNSKSSIKKEFIVPESSFRHRYDDYYDKLIVEYQERMAANVKKYKKIARISQKPQYSEHSYFWS